jgi:hypothetical protein
MKTVKYTLMRRARHIWHPLEGLPVFTMMYRMATPEHRQNNFATRWSYEQFRILEVARNILGDVTFRLLIKRATRYAVEVCSTYELTRMSLTIGALMLLLSRCLAVGDQIHGSLCYSDAK